MKKLQYGLLLFMGIFLIQSCLHEEEDLFEKSGAKRLNEAQKYYEAILTGAPNGWVLEYIAGDTDATRRGAFNFLLKFENGEVTASVDGLAMSDINPASLNPYEKKKSLYRLEQDMSITLSFSSYNSFLHYYHEQHGSYTTYKGDFEFIIMEADENLVVLRGKKYGNIMEMHRLPEEVTWEEYLEELNAIIDIGNVYSNFELSRHDRKIGTGSTNENYRYTFDLSNDETIASNVIYTRTGIKFIDPLTIDGEKVQYFKWDDIHKVYVSDDANNIKITPIVDPSYVYYQDFIGTYSLQYNNTLTTTVTVEEKVKGKTLALKGLADFDIELSFDKMKGTVGILTQDIGKSGNYTVVVVPWDTNAGYITWGVGIGMGSVLNQEKLKNEGVLEFSMTDNGRWGTYKVTGFILILFDSVLGSHSGATRIGNYSGSGVNRCYNLIFTKQ